MESVPGEAQTLDLLDKYLKPAILSMAPKLKEIMSKKKKKLKEHTRMMSQQIENISSSRKSEF